MKIRDEDDAEQVRKVRAAVADAFENTHGGALREVWAELGRRLDVNLELPDQESPETASAMS